MLKGTTADPWWEVWQALSSQPVWAFEWLPSHRSEAEVMAAGVLQEVWLGNDKANEAAKA